MPQLYQTQTGSRFTAQGAQQSVKVAAQASPIALSGLAGALAGRQTGGLRGPFDAMDPAVAAAIRGYVDAGAWVLPPLQAAAGAAGGAFFGGLSSWSWKGAGRGATIGAGLGLFRGGLGVTILSAAVPDVPETTGTAGLGGVSMAGPLYMGLGAIITVWGVWRAMKARGKR